MVKVEEGARVGAILSSDNVDKITKFLGYGTYDGIAVPDEKAMGACDHVRDTRRGNPKITLDSGKVVWGCECWWAPEDVIKDELEDFIQNGYKIVEVDIDAERIGEINSRIKSIDEFKPECGFDSGCNNDVEHFAVLNKPFSAMIIPLCDEHYEGFMNELHEHPRGEEGLHAVLAPDEYNRRMKMRKSELQAKLKLFEVI